MNYSNKKEKRMKKIKSFRGVTGFVYCMLVAVLLAACGKEESIPEVSTVPIEEVTVVESEPKEVYEYVPSRDYSLIWSDEFDGTELDLTKWSYQRGDGSDYVTPGWGNGESQIYTDSTKNVNVSDGTLKITALKEKLPNGYIGFTSGRIRTLTDDNEALFSTVFGRIEAKIMIEGGSGIWPAFWMLPADTSVYGKWAASGEIDIMEVKGRVPRMSTGTAHFGREWPANTYKGGDYTFPADTDVRDYHVYAIEWEPGEIRWYIDDVNFFTLRDWFSGHGANAAEYTHPAPFDVPFSILLNVAVGGNFDPDAIIKDESFPGIMTVDYVRVYQKNEGYEEELKIANSKGTALEDGLKTPLKSGDSIYNGSFNQGINHTEFWKTEGLDAYVDPFDYSRKLNVVVDSESDTSIIPRLFQTGLYLEAESTYGVRVDTVAENATNMVVRIIDDNNDIISENQIEVEAGTSKVNAYKINNENVCENATLEIVFENGARISVDNIMLMRLTK